MSWSKTLAIIISLSFPVADRATAGSVDFLFNIDCQEALRPGPIHKNERFFELLMYLTHFLIRDPDLNNPEEEFAARVVAVERITPGLTGSEMKHLTQLLLDYWNSNPVTPYVPGGSKTKTVHTVEELILDHRNGLAQVPHIPRDINGRIPLKSVPSWLRNIWGQKSGSVDLIRELIRQYVKKGKPNDRKDDLFERFLALNDILPGIVILEELDRRIQDGQI